MSPCRRFVIGPLTGLCVAWALALIPMAGHAATEGSGRSVTETRSVETFQAIAMHAAIDLVVRQGPQQSLQLTADDNLLPLLETVVETGSNGRTLRIRWKRGERIRTRTTVRAAIVIPQLSSLSVNGAGDIRIEAFETPALELSLAGSGHVVVNDLKTDDLGVRIAGSGDVRGSGTAAKLTVKIAGSGEVGLDELQTDEAWVRIAGSGDAGVNVRKTLDVSIAGSGDVTYAGAAIVRSRTAGSGSVSRR